MTSENIIFEIQLAYYFSKTKLLSLGDAGLQIELSTIRIPSHPDSIVGYNTNPIPTTDLSPRSRF